MKITPFGAAGGEVTGSAYWVQTDQASLFVDCGMFQGGKDAAAKNRAPGGVPLSALDAVLVTHGHLDHTGRLPLLLKGGYAGPIYATPATIEMTGLILRDSAKIQAHDAERENRKRQRAGEDPIDPLYTMEEAERTLQLLKPAPYHEQIPIAPGVRALFAEAGHMLGSASIELFVQENGTERKVIFSGDLGPRGAPILKDYEPFDRADAVIMESTYGDHDHRPFRETVDEFFQIVKQAAADGGKILVPTFAVGRAQLLTMLMAYAFRNKVVKPFPIFLDSPMAIEAWNIYRRHVDLFDDEMHAFLNAGPLEADLSTMQSLATAEESKQLNDFEGACLIIAGAGMCTAGRILHHLKQNLWKPGTHVLIVGYQAQGSLGRMLVDGATQVKIFGEKIAVRARVHTLGGFSAHAGQTDLLQWFSKVAPSRPKLLLTHGEDEPRQVLAGLIKERHQIDAQLPALKETILV